MKQGTIKTLGVAAVGIAFAATAAGTASAAGTGLEPLTGPAKNAVKTLPKDTKTLPQPSAAEGQDPVQTLLGGLPIGG
ncbi:hypothetical protein AAHZ94_19500 [Streptomyces sp. HSW2009]|uniref:hypothetical protein n=1 Tax=Streptomyces sp. HSW2009 TaxID=3142890 RepID=UPI0032EBBBD0